MAYNLNLYNGTQLTTVDDGTINTITELKFVGKNYAGYGEIQNENFLHLLENFSSTVAPANPVIGMLWYDNATSKLKFYDGSDWKTSGGAEASATEPPGLNEGDFWWNNATNQLFAKASDGELVLVGPQVAGPGITQMRSITVRDTAAIERSIIAATIEDNIAFIISNDKFILSDQDAIDGFDEIYQGITLRDTKIGSNGVTTSEYIHWGTASNALRLGGKQLSDFVTTDNTRFNNVAFFSDAGFYIGDDNDIRFFIDTDTQTPLLSLLRDELRIKDSNNAIITKITDEGIAPGINDTYNLGASTEAWANVYATNFVGTASKADALLSDSSIYYTASVQTGKNTIAVRDEYSEDTTKSVIRSDFFLGTATQAQYADLAEKYITAEELPAGTAVAVCSCEGHEVEPAKASDHCIGVVSTDPAYMMNSEADGQYIGLKGRLPVRVKGGVRKGEAVYAMDNGVSSTIKTTALVGIALETNTSNEEKLVECVLKV